MMVNLSTPNKRVPTAGSPPAQTRPNNAWIPTYVSTWVLLWDPSVSKVMKLSVLFAFQP